MPPTPFHQLGDEPLYCEAVHNHADADADFYSGSEDDHYEAPLHRRLHIERKAIDFLSGNVPILLSATLRGPFDREHWNNPWRSTRAHLYAEPAKSQPSQSRQTVAPDENLPDTQGTSLYPLPSPEITNPPSTRKNPYMDESDYSRVKTWREAVKSTSVSKDPFWQSQQDDSDDDEPRARKRPADPTWLRKRDHKKRRSANPTNSTPVDSPSRITAQTRGSQTHQKPSSQMVTRSLRNHSLREDELATNGHTGYSSPNPSSMANTNLKLPNLLRSGRISPRRKARVRQDADTSEDELSMPATTPTHNAKRHSTMVSTSSTGERSPSRRAKVTKSNSRILSGRDNSLLGRGKPEQSQLSQLPKGQSLGPDEPPAGAQTTAQMAEAALEYLGQSPHQSLTKQTEPVRDELLSAGAIVAKSIAFPQDLASLPSTQQDNSFFFHKRARSPAEKTEHAPPIVGLTIGATPSPSSLQLHVATADDQGAQYALCSGSTASVEPDPAEPAKKGSLKGHTRELVEVSGDLICFPAAAEAHPSRGNIADQHAHRTDNDRTDDGMKTASELLAKVEPSTTDESADVVQLQNTSKTKALEEPYTPSQMDGCAQSDSEWSTCLDSQNPTPASFRGEEINRNADDIPVVEYGVDGSSDPDWSTFIDTQDIMPVMSSPEASVKQEEIITNIILQGLDTQVDSDETTHVNIQNLPPVSPRETIMADEYAGDAYISTPSPAYADQANDSRQGSNPAKVFQDAEHFEASVGSTINTYTEITVVSMISETVATEMPGAEREEAGPEKLALPCPFSNQMVAASVKESDMLNKSTASIEPQQLQMPPQIAVSPGSPSSPTCDPGKPGENMDDAETRDFGDSSGTNPQVPKVPGHVSDCGAGSGFLDKAASSTDIPEIQSPWVNEAGSPLQMPPQAPSNYRRPNIETGVLDETAMQVQSPWNPTAATSWHLYVPPATLTSPVGNTSNLSLLAGKALAVSQQPQSPWGAQGPPDSRFPTPDFEMPIKAFSDFMTPLPVKKRASSNGSILRCSGVRSGILFKTPGPQKPDRRVHFAPLPSEEVACNTELDKDETDGIYDEEDVPYFDPSGQKTGSVRLPKPTMRTASPPPLEMSSVEVGMLTDHDQKFAKHFEAMSKRKISSRKSLRLLPSESQQRTSASQEIGAMAEAFVQASQTRRKGLELAAEQTADAECRHDDMGGTSTCVALDFLEDQENMEPVDDVSAVLDNLDDFLDNTWGIETGIKDRSANEAQSDQERKFAPI
ncbi:hypothetical protein diail_4831 [Diaporthe ilicicola]|nr:hypothetical protein diail_4831 [Diaporthe ilicicola]